MTHRYGRRQKALPRKRRPALSAIPSDREKEDQRHASLYCSMHSNLFSAASTFLSVIIASNCAFAVVCFSEEKNFSASIFFCLYIVSAIISCYSIATYRSKAAYIFKLIKDEHLNSLLYTIDRKLTQHMWLSFSTVFLSAFLVYILFDDVIDENLILLMKKILSLFLQ